MTTVFNEQKTIDINVLSESSDPTFNFEINAIEQITRIDDDIATELDFISGTIWDDNNANKTQDFGEEGLADIRVYLDVNANGTYESSETSTITDNLANIYSVIWIMIIMQLELFLILVGNIPILMKVAKKD